MVANQSYNIELPSDQTFLSSSTNIIIVQCIFQQALKKYVEVYKNKEVPLSFLEFYFKEIENYNYMFRKQTKIFFEAYNNISPNFELIAEIYNKSYFSQSIKVFYKEKVPFLLLKSTDILDFFDEMIETSEKEIASAIQNIKKITEHINSSDEIITFDKTYENFMISEIVRKSEFKRYEGKSKVIVNVYNNEDKPQIISATKRAERLTSERMNVSSKKGKVTKLVIPKLKLPTAFPKSVGFSRINSKYSARNFISASREILILNDLKINGVAYSSNFVEKRKAANES